MCRSICYIQADEAASESCKAWQSLIAISISFLR